MSSSPAPVRAAADAEAEEMTLPAQVWMLRNRSRALRVRAAQQRFLAAQGAIAWHTTTRLRSRAAYMLRLAREAEARADELEEA